MRRASVGVLLRAGYVLVVLFATVDTLQPADLYTLQSRAVRALSVDITARDVIDAARNVLLFAGWGLVWVFTAARGVPVRGLVVEAAGTGLVLSGAVEITQLFSRIRTPSVLDVMTNTAGAACGAFVTFLLVRWLAAQRRGRTVLGVPAAIFALGYGAAAFAEALAPLFRQHRMSDAWGPPLGRLRLALERVDPALLDFAALDLLLFVPAGVFVVLWLVEAGLRPAGAAAGAALFGGAVMAGAEITRGLVGYSIAYGPAFAHGLGFALGAAATALLLRGPPDHALGTPGAARRTPGRPPGQASGVRRPRPSLAHAPSLLPIPTAVTFAAYGVLLTLWMWRPFVPVGSVAEIMATFDPRNLIPLATYRDRTDLFTVADAAISCLLFLPVGALLATRPLGRDGLARGLRPGVLLVLGIELGQLFIADRWPDVTDILIQTAGLAIGVALIRRAAPG